MSSCQTMFPVRSVTSAVNEFGPMAARGRNRSVKPGTDRDRSDREGTVAAGVRAAARGPDGQGAGVSVDDGEVADGELERDAEPRVRRHMTGRLVHHRLHFAFVSLNPDRSMSHICTFTGMPAVRRA